MQTLRSISIGFLLWGQPASPSKQLPDSQILRHYSPQDDNHLSLARWPPHVPPTEQVQVQMKYGLSCVGIRVDNESITALRDSFALRKVGGHPREVAQYCRIRHVAE